MVEKLDFTPSGTFLKRKRNLVRFDPSDNSHLLEYAHFMKYGKWDQGCPFVLESPFFNVPTMVQYKLMHKFMKRYMDKV